MPALRSQVGANERIHNPSHLPQPKVPHPLLEQAAPEAAEGGGMTTHTLDKASRWSRYVPLLLLAGLVVSGGILVVQWAQSVTVGF